MKTYYLTLSKVFPATHPRKGEQTYFKEQFEIAIGKIAGVQILDENGRYFSAILNPKLHTIRANYELWRKRFEQIERGEACLSIRQWMGKPYASKQQEIARLTKEDGIGLQRLEFYNGCLQQLTLVAV